MKGTHVQGTYTLLTILNVFEMPPKLEGKKRNEPWHTRQ